MVRSSRTGIGRGSIRGGKKVSGRSIKNATSYDTLNAAVNQTFTKLGIGGGVGLNQSVAAIAEPFMVTS